MKYLGCDILLQIKREVIKFVCSGFFIFIFRLILKSAKHLKMKYYTRISVFHIQHRRKERLTIEI